jgi:hypothetical protein
MTLFTYSFWSQSPFWIGDLIFLFSFFFLYALDMIGMVRSRQDRREQRYLLDYQVQSWPGKDEHFFGTFRREGYNDRTLKERDGTGKGNGGSCF